MKCSNCGSDNAANTKFCTNCGTKLSGTEKTENVVVNNSTPEEGSGIGWGFLGFFIPIVGIILFFVWKQDKPKSSKAAGIGALISIIWSIVICTITFAILGTSFSAILNSPSVQKEIKNTTSNTTTKNSGKSFYTIDEDFTFGDYDLNISSTYEVVTVDNQYSSYNGKKLIKMPISIKNNGTESGKINSYYLKFYSPDGTQQEENYAYIYDDGLGSAGELRPGASYNKYLYFEHAGTGEYVIEFNNYKDKVEVKFKINE